jgi:hypothetical protein
MSPLDGDGLSQGQRAANERIEARTNNEQEGLGKIYFAEAGLMASGRRLSYF